MNEGQGPRGRTVRAAVSAAIVGAIVASVAVVLMYGLGSRSTLDVIAQRPGGATGFYDPERNGQSIFVWVAGRADISLAGTDRGIPWTCAVRFRGARPDLLPQPTVEIVVNDVAVAVRRATNDFQQVDVVIPAHAGSRDPTLSILSSPTFVPGDADRRVLGAQIDLLVCRPLTNGLVRPPRVTGVSASLSAAAFGVAFAVMGMTAGAAVAATCLIAVAQALPLSAAALDAHYVMSVTWLACWIAAVLAVLTRLLSWRGGAGVRSAGRFVLAFSGAALYLRLAGLLHPAKTLVDALFHAHRLESVLGGHLYFTQLSTSATAFPYAIGLYLASAPFALLTADHVTLLRVVVCAWEALACGLLYVMVVRCWNDRTVGAAAVVLASVVPVWYAIVGNANLTNAFGQSVSLVTVAAIVTWVNGRVRPLAAVGLILLATLALMSHISTFLLLLMTLGALAGFCLWLGGPQLRAPAGVIVLITAAALVLSVVLYWGHFGDVYRAQFARLGGAPASNASTLHVPSPSAGNQRTASSPRPLLGHTTLPLGRRVLDAALQTEANIGWPILGLALIGLWRVRADGVHDRLVAALAAWGLTWFVFVFASVLLPGSVRYQQDAWEFIGRVEQATYPAAVVLASRGAIWSWRRPVAWRVVSVALLAAAALIGVRAWVAWFLP